MCVTVNSDWVKRDRHSCQLESALPDSTAWLEIALSQLVEQAANNEGKVQSCR